MILTEAKESGEPAFLSFEDCIATINEELLKRKSKWRLTAIAWMDYDDVSQKIRLHIFKKWNQWDQRRPLKPWINTIITNQITNLIRNNYTSFAKPCAQCKHNQGGDMCEIYGQQSSSCDIFSKWEKGKKNAANINMPLSVDSLAYDSDSGKHISFDIKDENPFMNYVDKIENFHIKMSEKLSIVEWKIYNYIYIENKTEIDTAKLMGYKTSEKNRSPGYKQIKKIKNKIFKIAKEVVFDFV
jgi:hypothetical protein